MNDNSLATIQEAKTTVNESELDRIMQVHIDSGMFTKEQLAEMRKAEANRLKEAKNTEKQREQVVKKDETKEKPKAKNQQSTENLSQEERQKLSDEAFSIKERRTASGEVVKGSMGALYAKQSQDIIKSLVTDKTEREEILEGAGNVVDNTASSLYNTFTKTIPAEISRIHKTVAFSGLYDKEELDYLKTLDPNDTYKEPSGDPTGFKTNADRIKYLEGYKNTSAAKQEEKINKYITEKYKEVEVYNKYLRKDTGEGIVKGVKQGDASDVVLGVFNAGAGMAETVVPAMLTGGYSLPFQITAPMLMDYNQQKAERIYGKDDPDAVAKLLENKEDEIAIPAALGFVASSLERVGYKGITKYMLGKAVKGTTPKLLLTGNKEGITELAQSGIEEVNMALAQGKKGLDVGKAFVDGVFSEKGLESYLQGFIGGTGMSAGGRAVNRALRSDNASVKELNSLIDNLSELNIAKNSAKNKTAKEAIEVEIKQSEQALKKYIKEKRKIADILNEDQKQNLIDAINEKDNITSKVESLKSQLNNNEISSKEFGYAVRSLNNQDKRLTEQIEAINESAKQQLLVTGLEATKEEGETVGLKQELFETKEQYAALFGKKGSKKYNEALDADGHISDDGSTYYVNMDTARKSGAIGVGSHELLHGIIGRSFSKLKPEAQRKLNENFLNLLSKRDKETVLNRLAGAYGITGDKVFTTEELYTAFSDEIVDGGVKFNEGMFGKIKNAYEEILRQLSSAGYFSEDGKTKFLYRKEFGNARQAYNFVKDYSLTIKKTGKVTQRAKEFAKEDPGAEGKRESRSTVNLDQGTGDISQKIDALTKGAKTQTEFQQPGGAFDNVYSGMLEGKFDRIFGEGISREQKDIQRQNLADRLMNYDPAKTPELSKWIYGGSGKAGNVVYSGLVAKKKLFEEGEIRKKTTTIDTKEAKELEDTTSPTTEVEDKSKARSLESFNIDLEDGLANEKTIAEVEDLLEKNPDDIDAQMEKLILNDIRKDLDASIPKISKNKKTGKREPTPEYEAWVRDQYTEVVRSLGVNIIRKAYKPWFKQEVTGKKDYSGVSKNTGKKTNYIKPTQVNTTNKREYIRWFLESNERNLTERRTALIRRIARRKAKIATDNYIEANSKVLEAVVLAKLRKLSRAIEDTSIEQASFDSVKFSKSKMLPTRLSQEFGAIFERGNNGNPLVQKGTVWTGYINPYTNEPQSFVDKGRIWEQAFANYFMKNGIEGLKVLSEIASEIDGMADFVFEYNGKVENHELKASITAFMGSISISNLKNGKIQFATDTHNNLIEQVDMKEFMKGYKKRIDFVNKGIKKLNKKIKDPSKQYALIDYDVTSGKPQNIPYELYMDKKGFGNKMFYQLKADQAVIENHYKSKKDKNGIGVRSLSFVGTKTGNMSFGLDNNSILNLPRLDADVDVNFTFRNGGSKMVNGNKVISLSLGVQFKISKLNNKAEKSVDITIKEDLQNALGVNFSKSINGKKISNAIQFSRSNNKSKGITVLDFDDTLATSKSLVISTAPDAQAKIQAEADRLSRLTYQDYTDIGGETAPNTDIIGYRSAYSIVNEDTSEYERKKRRWERDYAEKKEMREKKSEEYLQAYKDSNAETKREIEIDAGAIRKLTAEEFAQEGADLLDQGWTHDFSEFSKVVDGKVASLFKKAMKLQGKFGPENMFVLTARPADSAPAIFDFLKANGLNIPIENITGLGNSTAEAKALWVADKVADGYNDFYFADDALQNVQAVKNMLDQFDVKSKVQQAKVKFSKSMSNEFNNILEDVTSIESQKVFSEAQAKIRGQKSKYKSIIPPSAQDFAGLLYNFLGKGKKGEKQMAFFKKALIDPFARAINELNAARQASANDYENLLKQFPKVKKLLNKKIEGTDYTHDQAVRIYLWNKAGFDIPGLSKRDLKTVLDFVENNSDIKSFAETVGLISKKEDGYSAPGDYWLAENIKSDLLSDGSIGDARAEFLAEWQQNADTIFSTENLNKIEAIYGSNFREALEDVLYRMKTGRNRPAGGGRLMNIYTNWVNNSVGAIMFFNMRSALLQTISATNYINWSDNNPLKAAAAFANQKQYWKDFSYLFNSDYLKQRRAGNQRGVNEAELSAAVAGAENKAKAAITWLLKKGFLPTQIADSFAIASGGATFYRNRIKALVKEGMTQEQAEKQAFLDFQETTEVAQQSARPDMISQQQASPLGKLILAFQNTPMQYARIMNKAARDLANGRGDSKTHMSKIIYYGFVQSIIFGALQSALFASLDDEDEEKFDKKKERILNGMVDSVLSGIGYGGKAVSTMKNTLVTFLDQRKRGYNADHTYTILQLLGFSPPIGSKLRKIYSSIQTDKFNKDVFLRRGFTLDNPIWSAIGNVVEGVTNVPLGRLSQKMLNIDNALDANNKWWQRVALVLGWNTWDLGIRDADIEGIKADVKKEGKKKKKKESQKDQININKQKQKQEKKEGKKVTCAAISKSGNRCKTKVEPGSSFCTIHEEVKQNKSGKKVQCKKIKSNKKRCGMQTSSASGYCYYHD